MQHMTRRARLRIIDAVLAVVAWGVLAWLAALAHEAASGGM